MSNSSSSSSSSIQRPTLGAEPLVSSVPSKNKGASVKLIEAAFQKYCGQEYCGQEKYRGSVSREDGSAGVGSNVKPGLGGNSSKVKDLLEALFSLATTGENLVGITSTLPDFAETLGPNLGAVELAQARESLAHPHLL